MARGIYILNKANSARVGMVTLGFPFERGEVTSTDQRIVIEGATPYIQKAQWEPFGADYTNADGSFHSYRYAKMVFRAECPAASEVAAQAAVSNIGYTATTYDFTILNRMVGINIQLSINNQVVSIPLNNLTLMNTASSENHINRYRYWGRPFPTMPWVWVEFVFDVPATGLPVNSIPVEIVKFWFRYGNSYAQRGLGRNLGTYTSQTRNFYLTAPVILTISGCESGLRFENHIYNKIPLPNGMQYYLEDPNFNFINGQSLNNNNTFKFSNCRNYRGFFVLGPIDLTSAAAERQAEFTAIAEGWNRFMPPSFTDVPLPPNVLNDRNDQKAKIDRMMSDVLASQRPLPYPAGPYGLRPYAPGAGDQGAYGNAFHHHPLYYTMKAAYSAELPYILHSMESHGYRPMWMYEADGTRWSFNNYRGAVIWWTEPHFAGNDYCGVYADGQTAPGARSSEPYEEWAGLDRQHCSVQLDAAAAILTADYYALEFCQVISELHAAAGTTESPNDVVNSWEADRASARLMQGLIGSFFATGNQRAFRSLVNRWWLGYAINESWRFGNYSSGIEQLKFIDAVGARSIWTAVQYVNDTVNSQAVLPPVGALWNTVPKETPHITPWQLSFVAIALFQAAKTMQELYPNGAYMVKPTLQSNFVIDGSMSLTEPTDVNLRMIANHNTARFLSRDLAASIIQHQTFKLGPNSQQGWYNIAVKITARPGLASTTMARAIECFPVGSTVTGVTSGTVARVILLEGGASDQEGDGTQPRFVNLFLKVLSGPGFTANGSTLLENIISSTGYNTADATPFPSQGTGFANNKWAGSSSYCMDRGGSSHNLPGTGPNYRVPLTQAQIEESDPVRIWNVYTHQGPKWCQVVRDYGDWQTAVTPIVLEGLNANYYWSNDPNYTVIGLRSKVQAILSDAMVLASASTSIWDMKVWPYMGVIQNFSDNNSPIITPQAVAGISTVPAVTVTTTSDRPTTISPEVITATSDVPPVSVFASSSGINATIRPLAVTNRKAPLVETPKVFTGKSIAVDPVSGVGSIPTATVIATTISTGASRSVVINLQMDGPRLSSDLIYIPGANANIAPVLIPKTQAVIIIPPALPQDPTDIPSDPPSDATVQPSEEPVFQEPLYDT